MKKVDIVILAGTYDLQIQQMTQACIDSAIQLDPQIDFNIILIESNPKSYFTYKNTTKITPEIPFHAAKYLNIGIKSCRKDTDLFIVANNDLIFTAQWATNLLKAFETYQLNSACPLEPTHHAARYKDKITTGCEFRQELIGWCIALTPETYKIINGFDEDYLFYYGDNDYIMKLKKFNLKHALVGTSVVKHLLSQSHRLLSSEQLKQLATKDKATYDRKWN